MPVCAVLITEPDGSSVFALDTSQQTDLSTCAYVVQTGSDFTPINFWQNLGPDDALTICTAVALLWAVAWGFRQVGKAINSGDAPGDG
jgi:hypothetical protein